MRHYETLPPLSELLDRGGLPGVEYIVVLTGNMAHYQENDGFHPLMRGETFLVKGKSCTLLGRGKPIPHGRPESHKCPYFMDIELKEYLNAVQPRDEAKEEGKGQAEQGQGQVLPQRAKAKVTVKPGAASA